MDLEEDFERFEEESSNIEERPLNIVPAQNAAEVLDAPIVGQTFGSWEDLDRFISLYTRSQNFASVIRGSEYSEGVCRNRSKRSGCRWQVRATFLKKTGILSISSVNLVHNDHLLENETNKFASKYRAFSEDMLKYIKFWTETGNINMRTQYQMLMERYPETFFLPQDLSNAIQTFKRQNHVECEAASTQRVEGQNGIIKHLVNSNTSLINLVKHIDEQIDRASTFVQYKNWIHSTTGATLIHASSEFSPDIDKWITAYLIPTSLSMQWQEIAQAIWYTSKLINNFPDLELQQSDLTSQLDITEQSDSIESLNTFIEDSQLESELQTRQQPFIIGVNNNNADGTNPKQSFPHASFCLPSVSFSEKRQQGNENNTISNCSSSNKEDFVAIKNPMHLEIPKGRKPIQCKQYQNTKYNRAG
ncbi:17931_t:CDS:2, partial [Gigaspora rosea]